MIGSQSVIPLKDRVKNAINSSHYHVKAGETLYSIAWRANSDVRNLAKWNDIPPPYRIYPGQRLFLSKRNTQTSLPASKTKFSKIKAHKRLPSTIKRTITKRVASNKKQAYADVVTAKKAPGKSVLSTKASFSQKISRWQWPVKGRVIEYFSNQAQGNKGINISGRRGTKIKAASDGKVVYAGNALRGYGNLVIVKHNDDYLSAYAHNDKILVKEQQRVKLGDVIAKMGNTGATTVMLHFEVRFRGKSVNPLNYLPKVKM